MIWKYHVETINTEYEKDDDGKIDNSPDGAIIIESRLDDLGSSGWELVGFLPALPANHFKGTPANPWVFHAVFKRSQES